MLMVGLGNPGKQYLLNRHNVGFMVLDVLAQAFGFPDFRRWNETLISEGFIGPEKVILLKPMNFMNLSGSSVSSYVHFYKIALDNIVVFHDDLDVSFGKVKMKQGGGSGGHNGLKSLDHHIGNAYWRVRVGIGHPGHKEAVAGYVLQNFSKDEQSTLEDVLSILASEVPLLLQKDMSTFINEVSGRLHALP